MSSPSPLNRMELDALELLEEPISAAQNGMAQRVLVFNFLGGVMERGIPIYTREIIEAMRRAQLVPIELRCPKWLRRAPSPILNIAYVIFEQIVAPLLRVLMRCSVTVYPGNSAGVIDALLGKSILVIHDLISNHRRRRGLAATYLRATQTLHRLLGRTVCAASLQTLSYLRRLRAFKRCSLHLWSNPFYSFAAATAQVTAPPRRAARLRVLLCTGIGPNKDYAGAIHLFRHSKALAAAELRIVGFGDDAALAQRRIDRLPAQVRERITLLPRLSLEEMAREYLGSHVVWVHSLQEGYGRSVVEARIASRPVIASAIRSFRSLRWLGITLYKNRGGDFDSRWGELLSARTPPFQSSVLEEFHDSLELSVRSVITAFAQPKSKRTVLTGTAPELPKAQAALIPLRISTNKRRDPRPDRPSRL